MRLRFEIGLSIRNRVIVFIKLAGGGCAKPAPNQLKIGVKMKRMYCEIVLMFVFMAVIVMASFKVPQSNMYLAGVCIATLALAIFGVSIGIRLENKFGEKDDKSN
jgi:glycerol uptake facilitator-like aquaporin